MEKVESADTTSNHGDYSEKQNKIKEISKPTNEKNN
jgi:hypothetical protein